MAIKKYHYSFAPGYNCLKRADIPAAKAELKAVLGTNLDCTFYSKKKDILNIPAFLKENIDKIFKKYGVKECDIWSIIVG